MPMSEAAFVTRALAEPDAHWELHCGQPLRKPDMSFAHNYISSELADVLREQLDRRAFRVRVNMGHVRRSAEGYYIPDVYVVPYGAVQARRHDRELEVYDEPLPLVIEVWSPFTGGYDVDSKLVEYQRRGDREIWRVHPYEQTLTSWTLQTDGSYSEHVHHGGIVRPAALPGVSIDLGELFA